MPPRLLRLTPLALALALALPAHAEQADTTMPVVQVSGASLKDGATEGTGTYQASQTSTATKLDLSPRDTPQTVTVVTRQQMDDFGIRTVPEALKMASGVFVHEQAFQGNTFYSRGFQMQSQFDGVANPLGIGNIEALGSIDSAFLDRVEVLQGANGLTSGSGFAGGTINLVRKRPAATFQGSAELQLGSWHQRRVVGDVSTPLSASGKIRGRAVVVADDSDSFTDYVYYDRRSAYAVLEADLAPGTTVSASIHSQKEKSRDQYGVPYAADGSDPGLPRSAYFANANRRIAKDYQFATLTLTQQMAAGWRLHATYIHGQAELDGSSNSFLGGVLNPVTGAGLIITQGLGGFARHRSNVVDAYVSGPLDLFGRKHELVFGANNSKRYYNNREEGWGPATPINIFTFTPATLPAPVAGSPWTRHNETERRGAYGVGRFSLGESLKLIAGARVSSHSFDDATYRATGTTIVKMEKNGVVSPYGGLVYDINRQYSAYLSYSDIFNPQTFKSANGGFLDPVEGANLELGVKGELLDGKLNAAAALFRLEQTNMAKLDSSVPYNLGNACGGYCYVASDKVVSEGADLSLTGLLQPGWNVAFGYTYVASAYAAGAAKGQRFNTNQPRNSARLATTYQVAGTAWTVGGNVSVSGRIQNTGSNAAGAWTIRRGGLALVGLSARYRITPQADLNVVVDNVFDRTYRASAFYYLWDSFGDPRRYAANLKYHF